MSPAADHDTKWLLGIAGASLSILVIVITATASITTKFNVNDADHTVIKQTLGEEITRSTTIDNDREESIKQINIKLDDVKTKQIQVMVKQDTILKAVEKIENRMP